MSIGGEKAWWDCVLERGPACKQSSKPIFLLAWGGDGIVCRSLLEHLLAEGRKLDKTISLLEAVKSVLS